MKNKLNQIFTHFGLILSLCALLSTLSQGSQAADNSQTYQLTSHEYISIESERGPLIWDIKSIQELIQTKLDNGVIKRQLTGESIQARITGLGSIDQEYDLDQAPKSSFITSQTGRIRWVRPQPGPQMVDIINRAIAGKKVTATDRTDSWTAQLKEPNVFGTTTAEFSVTPKRINGRHLAMLTSSSPTTTFSIDGLEGTITTRGFSVVSADLNDLLVALFIHEGKFQTSKGDVPFKIIRRIENEELGIDIADWLEKSPHFQEQAPRVTEATLTKGSTDRRDLDHFVKLVILSATREAVLSAEAEHRGNPVPIIAAAVAINSVSMADSAIGAAVRIVGKATGNKEMQDFTSPIRWTLQQGGETLGDLIGAKDPEQWGKNTVAGWNAVTTVTGITTIFVNPASVGGLAGNLHKATQAAKPIFDAVTALDDCSSIATESINREALAASEAALDCALSILDFDDTRLFKNLDAKMVAKLKTGLQVAAFAKDCFKAGYTFDDGLADERINGIAGCIRSGGAVLGDMTRKRPTKTKTEDATAEVVSTDNNANTSTPQTSRTEQTTDINAASDSNGTSAETQTSGPRVRGPIAPKLEWRPTLPVLANPQ